MLLLLGTGRMVKVGGGAAHIMDITLEIGVCGDQLGFPQDRFLTACADVTALMEGQGAEIAGTETATVVNNGEPHLFDGGNAAQRFIIGMIIPGIGQVEHIVQLLTLQRQCRGVLDEISSAGRLDQGSATGKIVFILLDKSRLGIGLFVLPHRLKRGQGQSVFKTALRGILGKEAGAANIPDLVHRDTLFQPLGDLGHGPLAHTVRKQVGTAVLQNGAAHCIVPVIVVGKPAQAGLDAADDNGRAGEGLSCPVGIHDDRPVGALARDTAGGIVILGSPALCHRIVSNHRVNVARIDEHAVSGLAHGKEIIGIVPVGLGQDGHPEAGFFQRPGDDRRTKRGVIHIGIAGDQQKVVIIPAPGDHILPVDRQKLFTCVHKKPPKQGIF